MTEQGAGLSDVERGRLREQIGRLARALTWDGCSLCGIFSDSACGRELRAKTGVAHDETCELGAILREWGHDAES